MAKASSTAQQCVLQVAQAGALSLPQDRFLSVHCSKLRYRLNKDKLLPESNCAAAGEHEYEIMKIIGMKQIWIYSGVEIKDVTVTERGLLLLLSVIQVSHTVLSTSHPLISE